MTTVLNPAQLFHIGIVADDFDAALEELSSTLGVHWKVRGPAAMDLHLYGEPRRVEMRMALTVEGPPHLELLSSAPDTPWATPSGLGVHHLCYWTEDGEAACLEFERQGARRILGRPGDPYGYFVSPAGVLVEIVTRRMRDSLVQA